MHPTPASEKGKALRHGNQQAIEKQGNPPHRDVLVRQNHRSVLHCPKDQSIQTVWIG